MDAEGFDSFRQARDYHPSRRDAVRWIVLHATQTNPGTGVAEVIQRTWTTDDGRLASTHGITDDDTCAGCVHLHHTAFGASSANRAGVHMEHCGWSEWTREQWLAHDSMLRRSARTTRLWADRFAIPIRWCDADDLRAGIKGVTDHATVEKAFPSYGHWDPGPGFPRDVYLDLMIGDDDVPLTPEEITKIVNQVWARKIQTDSGGDLEAIEALEYNYKRIARLDDQIAALPAAIVGQLPPGGGASVAEIEAACSRAVIALGLRLVPEATP